MPFEQLFSWPDHTLLFQALPITLTKENKSFLTQHFDQVQSGYSCYSNFFGGVEKINIVSGKKKKTHNQKSTSQALPRPGPGFQMLPFSAWFNESSICQQPISFRCDSDCPKAGRSLPSYPSLRAGLRNTRPRTKPIGTGAGLLGGGSRDYLPPCFEFRSITKRTWFQVSPRHRSVPMLLREAQDF